MQPYIIQINRSFSLFILIIALLPQVAAAEISFIPRAWVGVTDYEYKQDARADYLPEVKFNATFLMTGIGFTSTYERFYIDLSYQDSSEESDSFSSGNFYEKFHGVRRDYSSTIGMKVLDNRGNIYIGYKNGKTKGRGNLGTKLTFKEEGPFIGASYGWLIADKGFLAVNVAYADLDGNLKEEPGPSYPVGLAMDADSETTGLSFGVSWTGMITQNLGYSIAADANDYQFDDLKDNSTKLPLPDKIEETFYTGKLSIFYRF